MPTFSLHGSRGRSETNYTDTVNFAYPENRQSAATTLDILDISSDILDISYTAKITNFVIRRLNFRYHGNKSPSNADNVHSKNVYKKAVYLCISCIKF